MRRGLPAVVAAAMQHHRRRTSAQSNESGVSSTQRRISDADTHERTITTSSRQRATRSSTTTESSDVFVKHGHDLPVDENGRIKPYVDFEHFNAQWEKFVRESQTSDDGGSSTDVIVP